MHPSFCGNWVKVMGNIASAQKSVFCQNRKLPQTDCRPAGVYQWFIIKPLALWG
jgi:hypothetical protein